MIYKDGAFLCLNAGFYKITLVKVCTLVQKVVILASGKGCLRVKDDLSIFFEQIYFNNSLYHTGIADFNRLRLQLNVLFYWKEFSSLIMLRICCEKEKTLGRGSFTEMSTLIIYVFLSHCGSHKTKSSNSAICDHGIRTSKVSY